MVEHGMPYSRAMVLAQLARRKWQTRRLVGWHNTLIDGRRSRKMFAQLDLSTAWVDPGPSPAGNAGRYLKAKHIELGTVHRLYPIWRVGDRLCVKEALRASQAGTVVYAADGVPAMDNGESRTWKWARPLLPSRFMPRWAGRITREVAGVRGERLQAIDEAGAIAEGAPLISNPDYDPEDPCDDQPKTHLAGFVELWDLLNVKRGHGWDNNEWVWVLSSDN